MVNTMHPDKIKKVNNTPISFIGLLFISALVNIIKELINANTENIN